MTETVAPVAKPASRPRFRRAETVSASALALHLDCSRNYVGSRVAYLRYLRRERRQSPRAQADADYVKVKTEMLQTRLMEKRHELVLQSDVNELIDRALPASP